MSSLFAPLASVLTRFRARHWCATGALALLVGCGSAEYNFTTRIADGQRLTFRLINGRVEQARAEGIEVLPPQVVPDPKQKKLRFLFGFDSKGLPPITHVRVEDVADDRAVLLVDDASPALEKGRWARPSEWFAGDAPELLWLTYLDDSFRVYRITVTLHDGRTVVLHQGMSFGAFGKGMLRQVVGQPAH